ncbi:MAG: gliding motility lipoprotein GldH [Mucilaginibacter sp.]
MCCILTGAAFLLATGCADPNAVLDQNTLIVNNNWSYANKIANAVTITDETVPYNLYLNLRVTADYKYSNLFVLIRQINPDKKVATVRYEFKLANADGEWLGSGSGNIYSYQVPFVKNYKFPAKGMYRFEIEQNMRDNPLREVSDVGLRVERAQ